jgi:hypothetical protein
MKRVKRAAWPGLLAVFLMFTVLPRAQPAAEIAWNKFARFCWDDILRLPEIFVIERIPVGCEVVDCCPGCPGPPIIDWRIRVEGAPIEAVELTFENLPGDRAGQLKLEGDAKAMDGAAVRIGRGEAFIRGLTTGTGRPPVARLRLVPDKSWAAKEAAGVARDETPGSRDAGEIRLDIEQLVGKYIVNEYRLNYRFYLCPLPQGDRIDLNNNASNDQAVVLVDARRATGCVNDEVRRGNNVIAVGELLSNQTCRSEVAVFSDDDSMRFPTNVNAWTNNTGDLLPVNMTPDRLMAPVTVWLARANAQPIAQGDIANANLLYNTNNVGIGFNPTFNNVAGNPNAVTTINNSIGCNNLGALQGSAFFTANRLNVYYVGGANGAFTGVNCNANRNIQLVGTTANNQTLAHEFGHSMSLGHTNGVAGFPLTNVMIGGGAARTHFSEGQGFRLNVHCSSTINTNGVRAGEPTRNCNNTIAGNVTCAAADAHCPALALDVQPK